LYAKIFVTFVVVTKEGCKMKFAFYARYLFIVLQWIFKKWDERVWTGLIWLRIGHVAGSCECDNEPSVGGSCMLLFFVTEFQSAYKFYESVTG
jgi:hypothetical protein